MNWSSYFPSNVIQNLSEPGRAKEESPPRRIPYKKFGGVRGIIKDSGLIRVVMTKRCYFLALKLFFRLHSGKEIVINKHFYGTISAGLSRLVY